MDIWKRYLKRNDKVAWRVLEDKCILLHLDSGIYYTLNEVGKFLWESFDGKKELIEIQGEMVNRYDVDRETAKSDILEVVKDLVNEDLVKCYDKPPSDPSAL